jgi:hypothetical protein
MLSPRPPPFELLELLPLLQLLSLLFRECPVEEDDVADEENDQAAE